GREVEAFEHEFAAYHGMKHAVMVNSGSSANLIAVACLFHKSENPLYRNNVAAVPAIAWATTYAPLVQHGLHLLIEDVDETWQAVKTSWEPPIVQPRLRMFVPILGNALAVWDTVSDYMIVDCCESIGVRIDNQLCGTRGHLNTFSLFYSHQLSAIEGGVI